MDLKLSDSQQLIFLCYPKSQSLFYARMVKKCFNCDFCLLIHVVNTIIHFKVRLAASSCSQRLRHYSVPRIHSRVAFPLASLSHCTVWADKPASYSFQGRWPQQVPS